MGEWLDALRLFEWRQFFLENAPLERTTLVRLEIDVQNQLFVHADGALGVTGIQIRRTKEARYC